MCEYCEPDKFGTYNDFAEKEIRLGEMGDGLMQAYLSDYDPWDAKPVKPYLEMLFTYPEGNRYSFLKIGINYCPICGRKLKESDEE